MKNLNIVILIFAFTTLSCKAQYIIPVEKAVEYRDAEEGLLGGRTSVYVKDINNLLNKYVGIWNGNYNSKNYEFRVSEITDDRGEVKEDMLLIRYKITDNSGNIIENTLDLTNNNKYIIRGSYLDKTSTYVLSYLGKNGECGQNGDVYISVGGANNTIMKLGLYVNGEIYSDCTSGPAKQILPTKGGMSLIKQ